MMTINLTNLAVAKFSSSALTPELKEFKLARNLFRPESCSTQIWVGAIDDFNEAGINQSSLYIGKDAYALLLSFMDGALSKKKFENHSKSQFMSCWNKFAKLRAFDASRYKDIVKYLDKDAAFLRSKYTIRYKTVKYGALVRDAAEQKNGQKILIISDVNDNNHMHRYTLDLIKSSENIQKDKGSFITITHPDDNVLHEMKKNHDAQKNEAVRSELSFMPFSQLSKLLEESDIAYVGLEMGHHTDEEIVATLRDRSSNSAKLVHMRGCKTSRSTSSVYWKSCSLDHYISPEKIQAFKEQRCADNKVVEQVLQKLYGVCADLRAQGCSPSYQINSSAYKLEHDLA